MMRETGSGPEMNQELREKAVGSKRLEQLLERAIFELPNVDEAVLFSSQGSVVARVGKHETDSQTLALSVGFVQLAERTSTELGRGTLQHVAIQSDIGFFAAKLMSEGFTLVILGRREARLGLLIHDLEWLTTEISQSLSGVEPSS